MTTVCHRIPVFDVDVYFVTSKEDAQAFIQQHSTDPDADGRAIEKCRGCCYTVTDAEGRDHRMMCVFDGDLNTVVHESVHAAWDTLRHLGIQVKPSTGEEPLAILTAWLAQQMLGELAADQLRRAG